MDYAQVKLYGYASNAFIMLAVYLIFVSWSYLVALYDWFSTPMPAATHTLAGGAGAITFLGLLPFLGILIAIAALLYFAFNLQMETTQNG